MLLSENLSILDTDFYDNYATHWGGIFYGGESSKLVFRNGFHSNNSAETGGSWFLNHFDGALFENLKVVNGTAYWF